MDGDLLFVLNVPLHLVKLFSKQSTRPEVKHTLISSPAGTQDGGGQGERGEGTREATWGWGPGERLSAGGGPQAALCSGLHNCVNLLKIS